MDLSLKAVESSKEKRYLTQESVYDYDHPEVVEYTSFFMKRADEFNAFDNINLIVKTQNSLQIAEVVANNWFAFTSFVPLFITKAVSKIEDPEQQHYLIQIAYDELGGQNKSLIHSKLFRLALEEANISCLEGDDTLKLDALFFLEGILAKAKTEAEIIGLLLSFEIIAERNIETLYQGLCYSIESSQALDKSQFFKIHRCDESEHIRHSIANFIRFCQTETDINQALQFFDHGVSFWLNFWNHLAIQLTHQL